MGGRGVNHCSLHCRLANFRGLMYRVKYGAVIGPKARFLYVPSTNFQDMGYFKPIAAPYLTLSCTLNHGVLLNDSVNYSG